MTVQAILLGLGTLLLAVAAVVFTAVNWSRMDAATQGVILLVMTGAVAAATGLAARRQLPATAEALGLVTLVLALVDAHAVRVSVVPHAGLAGFWAVGLGVVAAVGWWLSRSAGIRSTGLVAVVLGQLPVVLGLAATRPTPAVAGVALLLQVAVVLAATTPRGGPGRRVERLIRIAALLPAAYTWVVVTATAAVWLVVDGPRSAAGLVVVMVVAAAVAGLAAGCWAHLGGPRNLALVVATVTAVASCGWLVRLVIDGPMSWALVGLVSAGVVGAGLRTSPRWGAAPAAVATWIAGFVAYALLAPMAHVVDRLAMITSEPWSLEAAERAMSRAPIPGGGADPVVWALHLVGLGALTWALEPRITRQWTAIGRSALVVVAVGLATLILPLSIGGAGAVAWCATVLVAIGVEVRIRRARQDPDQARLALRRGAVTSAALLGLASTWSVAARPLGIVDAAVVALVAVWVLVRAWTVDDEVVARIATGLAVLAVGVEAGLVAAAGGVAGVTAVACAGAAALAVATLGLLLLPRRLSAAGDLSAWSLHGLGILALVAGAAGGSSPGAAWRITLLGGVLAAGIRAARGRQDHLAVLAAGEALALWWLELAVGGVHAPEPYALPLAGVLAVAGLVAERRVGASTPRPGSWVTAGPALVVAAVPTVWVALVDPGGPRPLLALVAGMGVLAAGAFHGRRALVDVGSAVVTVLGLTRLLPVLADAPNWLTIGLTGAVLVAVGATFEQRRQDARGMRDRYSALR